MLGKTIVIERPELMEQLCSQDCSQDSTAGNELRDKACVFWCPVMCRVDISVFVPSESSKHFVVTFPKGTLLDIIAYKKDSGWVVVTPACDIPCCEFNRPESFCLQFAIVTEYLTSPDKLISQYMSGRTPVANTWTKSRVKVKPERAFEHIDSPTIVGQAKWQEMSKILLLTQNEDRRLVEGRVLGKFLATRMYLTELATKAEEEAAHADLKAAEAAKKTEQAEARAAAAEARAAAAEARAAQAEERAAQAEARAAQAEARAAQAEARAAQAEQRAAQAEERAVVCTICQDENNRPDTALIPCGHTLCNTCYTSIWAARGGVVDCPFCRTRVTDSHPLFFSAIE